VLRAMTVKYFACVRFACVFFDTVQVHLSGSTLNTISRLLPGVPSGSRRAFLAALASAGVAACAPPVGPLQVGTIVFPGYELLILAREMGMLQPGLVRPVELQNSSDSVRALAVGELDAALLTMDEVMAARAGGVDLRAVLVLDTSDGADQVLARPGINLSNLAGRRVAAEDNSVGALMMASLLEAAGLEAEQVVKVATTQSRAAEFYRRGLADVMVTAEPWAGQIRAMGGVGIFDSSAVPDRIVDVVAVRADKLQTHAEALRHLVAMQFAALDLYRQHPEQATPLLAPRLQVQPAQVVASFQGLSLPDRVQNQAMLRPGGTLANSLPKLQNILLQAKLLRSAVDTNALLDDRFVRAGGPA